MKKETILIALGGNALLQSSQKPEYEVQLSNVENSAVALTKLIKDGYQLILSHGNGPQVGNLLLQNEEAAHIIPPFPMDVLNAETQGFIGYMIVQCLENELRKNNIDTSVVNLLTRAVVDIEDPRFKNPTKPVGTFYTKEVAEKIMEEKGWKMVEDSGRGWRRVVPSPIPKGILEEKSLKKLVDSGVVAVAGGGGGIPVYLDKSGDYKGIEAVIDKDLCSCIMAKQLNVDKFMILTDVNNVYLNYGKENQQQLGKITVDELQKYIDEGHFAEGSMGPKIDAVMNFTKSTGNPSYICSLDKAAEVLSGTGGTVLVKE